MKVNSKFSTLPVEDGLDVINRRIPVFRCLGHLTHIEVGDQPLIPVDVRLWRRLSSGSNASHRKHITFMSISVGLRSHTNQADMRQNCICGTPWDAGLCSTWILS